MSLYRKLFYEKSKNHYTPEFTPSDPATWPEEWIKTYYKEYPRFGSIQLPDLEREHSDELFGLLSNRRSQRDFTAGGLSVDQVSTLLKYSCGEFAHQNSANKEIHRPQPSGGGRYPVEMYALVFSDSAGLRAGVYHYNPRDHKLEWLWPGREKFEDKNSLVIEKWVEKASVLFVMTGVFWRSETKYNERGSAYVYLEAGHIAQNIHLLCQKLKLKSVGLGGVWDDSLEELLRLDTDIETPVHVVAVGT